MSKASARLSTIRQARGPELLRGDHCRCPSCGERFNSAKAFDQHRVGWFSGLRRMPSLHWIHAWEGLRGIHSRGRAVSWLANWSQRVRTSSQTAEHGHEKIWRLLLHR